MTKKKPTPTINTFQPETTKTASLQELADALFALRATSWNGERKTEEELTLSLNAAGISGLTKLFDALNKNESIHEGIIQELKEGVTFGLHRVGVEIISEDNPNPN